MGCGWKCASGVGILTAGLLLAWASARPAAAGTPVAGFTDTAAASGLSQPTAIAFLPDGRFLVTEKGGGLLVVNGTTPQPLATIPVCSGSEMGLLGIAVDPGFAASGHLFLYRTESDGGCGSTNGRSNEVVRVTMGPGDTVSLASLSVLLTGIRTDNGNHDGGVLRIGPDGKLYVGVGDTGLGDNVGGPGTATNPYAQDLGALEGKVLRLELTGAPAAGNPFLGLPRKRGEIFASGFRNPFRMSFDPLTGRLWAGDVGDLTIEEVDIVERGGNYGWPHCEGTLPGGCQQAEDIDPILTYPHGGPGALGTSITGGSFAGACFGAFANHYFFGDYTASAIYRVAPNALRDGASGAPASFVTSAAGPVDIVTGPDGSLYYVAINDGEVRRVAPDGTPCVPATTTTTTTTLAGSTTTSTTLAPAACEPGPSFAASACRLREIGALAGGLPAGAVRTAMLRRLARAAELVELAGGDAAQPGGAGDAKLLVRAAAGYLNQASRALRTAEGRGVEATLRRRLLQAVRAVLADLARLRRAQGALRR